MSSHQKNQKISCSTHDQFSTLVEEIRDYIGRDVLLNESELEITVLALPRKYKKKIEREKRLRRQRQDRDDDYSIPSEDDYADEY